MLGGVTIPTVPQHAMVPAAKSSGYPSLRISGIITRPIAATVAEFEPLMAANPSAASMAVSARPPRSQPTTARANATINREIPPSEIKSPREDIEGHRQQGKVIESTEGRQAKVLERELPGDDGEENGPDSKAYEYLDAEQHEDDRCE